MLLKTPPSTSVGLPALRYSTLSLILASVLVTSACSPAPDDAAHTTAQEESLSQWLDEQYAHEVAFSPTQLSRQGDHSRHGEIDSVSQSSFEQQLDWKAQSVAQMQAMFDYDSLTADEQLSYDLWAFQYQQSAESAQWRPMHYVFEQMIGPQSRLPQVLIGSHSVHNHQDMGDYNKRIRAIADTIEALLEQAQAQVEAGIRPPQFTYREVIRQAQGVIQGKPFDDDGISPLWADAESKVMTLVEQGHVNDQGAALLLDDTRAALTDDLKPAYQALIDWLEADKHNAQENPVGISRHPQGDAFYDYLLEFYTTTEKSAAQIHQLGLDEVERLRAKMHDVKERTGFEGDLEAFFDHVRHDDEFFYPNTDAGREAYLEQARDYLAQMEQRMPDYFGIIPDIELEVRRVESYREQAGAPQHYMAGSADGSRPGIFYAHLIDMTAMPKNELEAIAYHEGIPGHHHQISVAQQLQDIPRFRTQARFTVFTEGWALYAEWLAREMGAYEDPYSEFGQLVTELWRAVRLVVDTGLHAKGWTKEEAIDYFAETTPIPRNAIRTEVHRYMTHPGQATSFKIGMMRIQQLRQEAEEALGEHFDIRDFHDAVLGGGALPLPLLERQVRDWIDEQT